MNIFELQARILDDDRAFIGSLVNGAGVP